MARVEIDVIGKDSYTHILNRAERQFKGLKTAAISLGAGIAGVFGARSLVSLAQNMAIFAKNTVNAAAALGVTIGRYEQLKKVASHGSKDESIWQGIKQNADIFASRALNKGTKFSEIASRLGLNESQLKDTKWFPLIQETLKNKNKLSNTALQNELSKMVGKEGASFLIEKKEEIIGLKEPNAEDPNLKQLAETTMAFEDLTSLIQKALIPAFATLVSWLVDFIINSKVFEGFLFSLARWMKNREKLSINGEEFTFKERKDAAMEAQEQYRRVLDQYLKLPLDERKNTSFSEYFGTWLKNMKNVPVLDGWADDNRPQYTKPGNKGFLNPALADFDISQVKKPADIAGFLGAIIGKDSYNVSNSTKYAITTIDELKKEAKERRDKWIKDQLDAANPKGAGRLPAALNTGKQTFPLDTELKGTGNNLKIGDLMSVDPTYALQRLDIERNKILQDILKAVSLKEAAELPSNNTEDNVT